jgi:hypothetical protein
MLCNCQELSSLHPQPPAAAAPPHLLVPALDGALALPQVHHLALPITKDLHLNVVRLLDVLLNKHLAAAAATDNK